MKPFILPVVAGLFFPIVFLDNSDAELLSSAACSPYHSITHQPPAVHYRFISSVDSKIISGFGASLQNGKRTLTWTISKENNLSHFEIEFAGSITNNFKKIGEIVTDSSETDYSFIDTITARESINYYRIKIVEKGGNFRYSTTVALNCSVAKFISVFPNPSKEKINLATLEPMKNATVKIVDSYGRVVYIDKNISGTKTSINISSLPDGFYFVRVENGNIFYSSKFIK